MLNTVGKEIWKGRAAAINDEENRAGRRKLSGFWHFRNRMVAMARDNLVTSDILAYTIWNLLPTEEQHFWVVTTTAGGGLQYAGIRERINNMFPTANVVVYN